MTNMPTITPSDMFTYALHSFRSGDNVHFHGASGIGKSYIAKKIAKYMALQLGADFYEVGKDPVPADLNNAFAFITFLTATQDVLDIKGAPELVDGKTTFRPNGSLPDVSVHGRWGVWFLDEISQGAVSVTNGLTGILLGGQLGEYTFPKDWHIMACSNRRQDNANITKLGAQVHQRFDNYEVGASVEDSTAFMMSKGSNGMVPALLRLRPELLHHYTKGDIAFATPRSWSGVDRMITEGTVTDKDVRENIAASKVGVGPASELEGFLAMASQLTSWNAIVSDPLTANLPEPGSTQAVAALFALIGMVCSRVDNATIDQAMAYVGRMPQDFQVTFMLDLQSGKPDLMDNLSVSQWRSANNNVAI